MFLFKSITRRIIFLHVIAISITSAFMPVALYLLLRSAADDLQHRALRENAGLGREPLHVPVARQATHVYNLTRCVYQVKQRGPKLQNVRAVEMRLVPSVGRLGGRDLQH